MNFNQLQRFYPTFCPPCRKLILQNNKMMKIGSPEIFGTSYFHICVNWSLLM